MLKNFALALFISLIAWVIIIFSVVEAFSADARIFYYQKIYNLPYEPAEVSLDKIVKANDKVNRTMTWIKDKRKKDTWTIGGRRGDCDDFAVTKLAILYAKGVPGQALRLARTTFRGREHMVLVVYTTSGKFVLDNARREVYPYTNEAIITGKVKR